MKTLSEISKKDKTNLVTKKDGTLKARVIKAIKYKVYSEKIYFSHYTGSGRYISLITYEFELTQLLKLSGYKFTKGNDAPKGGKQGDYLKVSKTAVNFLQSIA